MSIPATNPRVQYIGTGSGTTYAWTWLINQASDLHVAVIDTLGHVVTLVLGTDYTIQTPATQIGNSGGGNIILTATGFFAATSGNLPAGYKLVIRRAVTFQQPAVLNNQGSFSPSAIEDALDFLEMQVQQLQDQMARCLQVPTDDAAPVNGITTAANRASTWLAFDGSGNPFSAVGALSAPVSNFGATFAAAINAAAALEILEIAGLTPRYVVPSSYDTDGSTYTRYFISLPTDPTEGGLISLDAGLSTAAHGAITLDVVPAGTAHGESSAPVWGKIGYADPCPLLNSGTCLLVNIGGPAGYWRVLA